MPTESDSDEAAERIIHRRIDPMPDTADYTLLEVIAELEECDVTDLPPMYDRIDHLLTKIYENPPSPKAQVELKFSYYGYRITVDQAGTATLVKLADPPIEEGVNQGR